MCKEEQDIHMNASSFLSLQCFSAWDRSEPCLIPVELASANKFFLCIYLISFWTFNVLWHEYFAHMQISLHIQYIGKQETFTEWKTISFSLFWITLLIAWKLLCYSYVTKESEQSLPFSPRLSCSADLYLLAYFSHSETCSVFCNAVFRGFLWGEILF